MYTVIKPFKERFDGDHQYAIGDTYPRDGFTPPEGRIDALASGKGGPMNKTPGVAYLAPTGHYHAITDVPAHTNALVGDGSHDHAIEAPPDEPKPKRKRKAKEPEA